jgi:hypothetical protein
MPFAAALLHLGASSAGAAFGTTLALVPGILRQIQFSLGSIQGKALPRDHLSHAKNTKVYC